jgi:hypothetical protein
MPAKRRRPRRPTGAPPPGLLQRAEAIHSQKLAYSGVTATEEGHWAVLLQVKRGEVLDPDEARALAGPFPVVVQEDSGEEQVARPAFPGRGE